MPAAPLRPKVTGSAARDPDEQAARFRAAALGRLLDDGRRARRLGEAARRRSATSTSATGTRPASRRPPCPPEEHPHVPLVERGSWVRHLGAGSTGGMSRRGP